MGEANFYYFTCLKLFAAASPLSVAMSDDPYASAAGGSLKLKSSLKKKKKKSKKETKERIERHLREESRSSPLTKVDSDSDDDKPRDNRTAAQIKYDEVQKQRQLDRVMKKAEKTHKERVEDFNRHLDELSEHYDIPKVSWTK